MRNDKLKATKLRKEGKSYNEISELLGISKSTLSGWFSVDVESNKIKQRLSHKNSKKVAERIKNFVANNKERWQKWREDARKEAAEQFAKVCDDRLFVAGLMLYWAEGDNQVKTPFRFTNTNPNMISLYVRFLTQILKVPRNTIRPTVILYPDLNEKSCVDYWSKVVGVPRVQFYKTQVIRGRHQKRRLSWGICTVMCGGGQLKEKVRTWIDLLHQNL